MSSKENSECWWGLHIPGRLGHDGDMKGRNLAKRPGEGGFPQNSEVKGPQVFSRTERGPVRNRGNTEAIYVVFKNV